MAGIKPMDQITGKWRDRAQVSQEDYRNGVANTPKDWARNTTAAASTYKAGMQAALAANRWEGGVSRAGTDKWRTNTMTKGPERWAQGVSLSGDAYANGFAPYHQVISGLTLKPRGPRGSAGNYERVKQVGDALHQKRIGAAR